MEYLAAVVIVLAALARGAFIIHQRLSERFSQLHEDLNHVGQRFNRLDRRLTALEKHIMDFGPNVQRSDPSIIGGARWEEPYRPPDGLLR